MSFPTFWLCFALVFPLAAQTASPPWDILGSRTLVTPFQAGYFGSKLLPDGDVLLSGSSCNTPAITLTNSYGNTSQCSLVIARVNPAGNNVFAIQLGGVDLEYLLLVDPNGNIFIGGQAESSRFAATPEAYLTSAPRAATFPNYSANFACKLQGTDGLPIYCTFLDDTAAALTLDAAGDLLFTAGTSIVELSPAGGKLLQSVPIAGTVTSIAPNADGTLYLTGQMPAGSYFGKFNLRTGFVFTQYFPASAGFTIAIEPSVGPILAGNLGSGFMVRQYAADGMTIVYDDSFPSVTSGTLSAVDGGVVLAGYSSSATFPLDHNLYVCGQILAPGAVNSPLMIRLDPSGAVLQSTWLGAASFGFLVNVGGVWSALGPASGNGRVQVLSVGPNPAAQPMTIGCMMNLAGANSAASPGLLIGITIENNGAVGSASAKLTSSGAFPTSLAGITITFNGAPAPLFALNGQQLNGAVPFSVAGNSTVQMCIASPVLTGSCTAVQVLPFTPAVLAVTNEDGSVNSPANPAAPGSIVSFYAIGFGALSPAVPDGTIVGLPVPALAAPVAVEFPVSTAPVFPGQLPPRQVVAQVTYAGPAPDEVAGVYQINAVVPGGVPGPATIIAGPASGPVASAATGVSLSTSP